MSADETTGRDEQSLLEFLRERDSPCPYCGYNLRNLTSAACPECHEPLHLKVSPRDVRLGWFLAAIAPGTCAGLMAIVLTILMIRIPGAPTEIVVSICFGIVSGTFTLVMIKLRKWFCELTLESQRLWALLIWLIHVAAFVTLVWVL